MSKKIVDESGAEIEVYTAEEVKAQLDVKETEFGAVKSALETELAGAKTALGDRAREFGQFRELNKELVDKLGVAERTIYENQKAAHEQQVARETEQASRVASQVETAIRAKVGTDEKLYVEMKKMYDMVGITATTPEEIERKTAMALGALGMAAPDLMASVVGFSGGSYTPPSVSTDEKTFAQTDRGQAAAKELGLLTEVPKK